MESVVSDRSDAVADGCRNHTGTALECFNTDVGDSIGYDDRLQVTAILKSIVFDGGDGIRNIDGGQTRTVGKGITADESYGAVE